MDSFKDKILGEWLNSSIRYVFYEDGKLTINWVKDDVTKTGNWSVENDEIIFKYGDYPYITWKGRINHINVQELSITDLSHQKGVIDVLYRRELSIIDPIIEIDNNISPTPVKKNFKEKLTETVWGVISIVFFVALLGGVGYLMYNAFKHESHEYTYFMIGMVLFGISTPQMVLTLLKGSDTDSLFWKGYLILFVAVLLSPLIYIVFATFFVIITHWYYLLSLGVIITLVRFILIKEEKWFYKSIIIFLSIASLYFFYDAKSILKIKFEIYLDDKIVRPSSYDE